MMVRTGRRNTGARASKPEAAEALIDRQLEAYNAHDLEGFLAFYADDAQFYDPLGASSPTGLAAARERYRRRFTESPEVHVEIEKRIVQGEYVIDQEFLTGLGRGDTLRAVVVYQVRAGRIRRVWFLK